MSQYQTILDATKKIATIYPDPIANTYINTRNNNTRGGAVAYYPYYMSSAPYCYHSAPSVPSPSTSTTNRQRTNTPLSMLLYAIPVMLMGASGICAAAWDDAITLYRSGLDTLVDESSLSDETKNTYELWRQAFLSRAEPVLYNKIGVFASISSMMLALYVDENTPMIAGLLGFGGCVGYLLWEHLTRNLDREQHLFRTFTSDVSRYIAM